MDLKNKPKKSKSKSKTAGRVESVPPTPSAPKRSSQEKRNNLFGDENENEIQV